MRTKKYQQKARNHKRARKSLTDHQPSRRWTLADLVVCRNLDLVDGGSVEVVDVEFRHAVVDPYISTKTSVV